MSGKKGDRPRPFTPVEDAKLLELRLTVGRGYGGLSLIGKQLGRSPASIFHRLDRLAARDRKLRVQLDAAKSSGRPEGYAPGKLSPAKHPLHPIVARLRQRRVDLGMTQETLARKIGWTTGALQGWERGENKPQMRALEDWAAGLGLELTVQEPAQ